MLVGSSTAAVPVWVGSTVAVSCGVAVSWPVCRSRRKTVRIRHRQHSRSTPPPTATAPQTGSRAFSTQLIVQSLSLPVGGLHRDRVRIAFFIAHPQAAGRFDRVLQLGCPAGRHTELWRLGWLEDQ